MTVLVAAASKHGATTEIAARIGADLARQGFDVEVKRIEEAEELSRYEAFVVGSGIYLGNWLKSGRRFLDTHAAEFAERPTWLFASGPIVGDPPADDDTNALRAGLAERLIETTHAREHKIFAGKVDAKTLGLLERAAVRAAHATDGDHRDWKAIDEWAATIAGELRKIRAKSAGGTRGAPQFGSHERPTPVGETALRNPRLTLTDTAEVKCARLGKSLASTARKQ